MFSLHKNTSFLNPSASSILPDTTGPFHLQLAFVLQVFLIIFNSSKTTPASIQIPEDVNLAIGIVGVVVGLPTANSHLGVPCTCIIV